ncbi:MAG: inositol monophosphatase [Desulfuromonadales bacterium]|nr:inositol monophosphatase [Desulfuromonadales bacterium]
MRETLLLAASEAGRILMEKYATGVTVAYKGAIDLVTEADLASEQAIVAILRTRHPEHDILAEEGDYGRRGADQRWIVDPLDGTTNFAHGFPWFAVSIALELRGEVVLGAVFNPYNNELFVAERGKGATLNGRPLRVSSTDTLERALLATGFAYDHRVNPENNYSHFERFQRAAQAVRRAGVASLDLACVAAGRFDGFWELKLKPWDVAAGVLLVEEAGGRVSDYRGAPMPLDRGEILASNGHLHVAMQRVLRGAE